MYRHDMMYGTGSPRSFGDRLLAAARLDRTVYEEVEHDRSATGQAAMVILVAAVAAAIGQAGDGTNGLVAGLLGGFLGWVVSSAFIYFAGTRVVPSARVEADLGQVLRTQGFAAAPTLLLVVAAIPLLGGLIAFAVGIWYIITRVVAIQAALEASLGRAIGIAIVAVILEFIVLGIMGLIFGVGLFAVGTLI
ncbi:MAG TPA: YIP1 family protein [Thermomicrobiales bacterium]|jgi:hypothetical protein|nr:YIP1 family protein [Thermomicrobiales bacterium]